MQLKILVDEGEFRLDVPDDMIAEADEFFAKMDRDMDRGWQMSREYVERPDPQQRCQIVADKLVTALLNGRKTTALLMAGYILTRAPGIIGVDVDTTGEMQNTELLFNR